jgi:hypothetical protein
MCTVGESSVSRSARPHYSSGVRVPVKYITVDKGFVGASMARHPVLRCVAWRLLSLWRLMQAELIIQAIDASYAQIICCGTNCFTQNLRKFYLRVCSQIATGS